MKWLLGSAVVLLSLDAVWLGFLSNALNLSLKPVIEKVQKKPLEINYLGAILAYSIMTIGLRYLVLEDALQKPPQERVTFAAYRGALFGFVTYGLFDATNIAIFENYSGLAVTADIAWGTILMGTSAAILAGLSL